jgi:putative ABC transport system permease protein
MPSLPSPSIVESHRDPRGTAADPADTAANVSVHRLVVLPWGKSVEIALKSIRVRFIRSLVTTLSLVLAIAFLSFVNVGNHVANGLLATGDEAWFSVLVDAGYDLSPGDLRVDSSPKQRWIVILSLLVCVVGIVNAQLMAVTERFREIGTMKCLGALDRFILRLFFLEAGLQGLIGAAVGALFGCGCALLGAWLRYGATAIIQVSWVAVLDTLAFAVGTGCVLSMVGVFYPALVAARMQPVEAMRVEQ